MSGRCAVCGAQARYRVAREDGTECYCDSCFKRTPEGEWKPLLDSFARPLAPAGKCPHCGWTVERLEQTGLVGCPLCYEALDRGILAGFAPKPG